MPGFFHGVTLGPPETPLIQGFTPEDSNRWREWKAARYKFYMQSIQRALKHTYRMLFINCIPIDEEYIRMVLKKVDLATIASALESGFVFETIFMRSPLYEQFKAKRAAEKEKAAKLENVAGSGGGGNSTDNENLDTDQKDISHLPKLRQEYIKEVRNLAEVVDKLRNQEKTSEDIARMVSQMRRDLGIKYKDMTPPELREIYYEANIKKYGDPLGPTIEYLRSRGNTWEEIIASACREGGRGLPGTKKSRTNED
jgi:archaellum component FlaC